VCAQIGQTGGFVGPEGVGAGGFVGEGPPPPPGQDAHQHDFPPLPQPLLVSTEVHSPPATTPSAQIVAARGSFLAQTYLSTDSTGAEVGGGVGAFVGLGVGGFVGLGVGGGFVGAFVGLGVGGFVGLGVGGFVGTGVGAGVGAFVGTGVGACVGEFVGLGVGTFVGTGVGADVGGFVGLGVGGFVGLGVGGAVVGEGVGGNVVGAFEGGLVGLTGALVGGGVAKYDQRGMSKKSNRSEVIIENHRQRQSLHASNYLRALLGTGVGGLVGLGDGGGVVLHDPYKDFVSVEVNCPPEARLTPPYSTV